MLDKDSQLKKKSILFAIVFTCIATAFVLFNSYHELNKNLQKIVFPNISQKFNEIAFNTQNQFDSLEYTSIREDYLTNKFAKQNIELAEVENAPKSPISTCIDEIKYDESTDSYSSHATLRPSKENFSGVLLGKGSLDDFSDTELRLLCTVLSTGRVNSEAIRMVKENPKLDSLYYYVSSDKPYFYIYNVEMNDNRFLQYKSTGLSESLSRMQSEVPVDYWISEQYVDPFTGKKATTFIKNIFDHSHQIRGFLVRDIYKQDLTKLVYTAFNQIGFDLNSFDHLNIRLFNHDRAIYDREARLNIGGVQRVIDFTAPKDMQQISDFGNVDIQVSIGVWSLFKVIVQRDPILLFATPFFIAIFSYMFFLQLFRGFREGNKQYFDSLTPSYNRNGLYKIVFKKIEDSIHKNTDVHIFSIDANKFKQINDKYGHDMGDRAIKLIVNSARYVSKANDDIVRMGGDEFLVFLYIRHGAEFSPDEFMDRLNKKIAYDCKSMSIPLFTVSAGHILFDINSDQTLSQALSKADNILINKKSVKKIDTICEEFDSFDINLSDEEVEMKLNMHERLNYISAEHKLQTELNEKVLSCYHGELNYLISNYFQLMYKCNRTNNNLHEYRMRIVESHHQAGLPMSLFYFLFVKYSNFLFDEMNLTAEEKVVNNRVISYELHFVSSLKTR